MEETGVTGENHRPVASYYQSWSHNVGSSTPHPHGSIQMAMQLVFVASVLSMHQ